jgi:CDP-glucose 4,6-dehydratase
MGAQVTGYALDPPTTPSLFILTKADKLLIRDIRADIRDGARLAEELRQTDPEIVFHLAAQPLVRESYRSPVETYTTNVMGTIHLLEAVKNCPTVRAVVNVTTDKCYENREWSWGYRENEPMGGYDPYSSSKGCSELVTAAWRRSYFSYPTGQRHGAAVATARAGNVIGGGDWAADRLVPDCLRALLAGEEIVIRSPHAIRPWQHVLEPLSGYLLLSQMLYTNEDKYAEAWNFGPLDDDARPVEWIVRKLCSLWGGNAAYRVENDTHLHEAHYLKLDISKARVELGWRPRWSLEKALTEIIDWTRVYRDGGDVAAVCRAQIDAFQREERS